MIPIAKLKHNLDFNKSLGDLIEVMKLAAISQFNQFRGRQGPGHEFSPLLKKTFGLLHTSYGSHPLLRPRTGLPAAIILISSDEGFLGELNALLINKLTDIKKEQDKIFVLGQQGANYLEELNYKFTAFASSSEKLQYSHAEKLRDEIFRRYFKREIGSVQVIYARFLNITAQQVESEALLPFPFSASEKHPVKDLLVEPDIDSVLAGLIKLWLGFRFYSALWSSKLAEFAARIMHLEGSIQELNKVNQNLKLEYFKYLHALSDKTIREISSARISVRH